MLDKFKLVLDIDGTICPIKAKEEKYEDLVPYPEMIDKIRELKAEGAYITFFTARNMNTHNGQLGLINKHTAKILMDWLEKWDIPYDEIIYGKPWPDHKGFYVDDRTVRPKEFLNNTIEELEEICKRDREI